MSSIPKYKFEIAHAFMDIVAQQPPQKRVTVVDVSHALDIDRKTFYNYFENTDDLSHWIYRNYLKEMLEGPEFQPYKMVKPDPSLHDPYPDWPFYTRIQSDEHFLTQKLFFKTMAYHFEGNRAYYSKVFQQNSSLNVYDYIINLFLPAFKDDVLYLLDGREMPEVAINFLTEYHVMGVFGRLRYHFTRTGNFIMQDEVDPYWNYAHTMIKRTIDGMFEEKESVLSKLSNGKRKPRSVYSAKL